MTPRRSIVLGVGVALALSLGASAAPVVGDSFAVRGAVIAGGGGSSRTGQGCFALDGTVAEAATGSSSGGEFALRAGFWAGAAGLRRDSVFRDHFEECQ